MTASPGRKDVIELRTATRIEKNPRDMAGMTPSHITVYNGHKEIMKMLTSWKDL